MDKEMTNEQAQRLLKAIFNEPEEETGEEFDENYPSTIFEKADYAGYALAADLEYIGKAINRTNRLCGLLRVTEKYENGLPPIILRNELRMVLEPLLRVRGGINEISDMLLKIYRETKPEDSQTGEVEG